MLQKMLESTVWEGMRPGDAVPPQNEISVLSGDMEDEL